MIPAFLASIILHPPCFFLLRPCEAFSLRQILHVVLMPVCLSLKGDVPIGMMPTKAPQFPKEEKRVEDIEANVPQLPLLRVVDALMCVSLASEPLLCALADDAPPQKGYCYITPPRKVLAINDFQFFHINCYNLYCYRFLKLIRACRCCMRVQCKSKSYFYTFQSRRFQS